MTAEDKDLENFLKQVDEISDLVKHLNSADLEKQKAASEKADALIKAFKNEDDGEELSRIKLNRTLINTKPSEHSGYVPQSFQCNTETSQGDFLKMLEKDAQERSQRRRENEKLAKALKEMGNEAFHKGDYETAVQLYSEGLEKLKDMQVLYTNRAQCNEKCIKAFVHMGRANLALKNFEEARSCYAKVAQIDSKQELLVKDYINEVNLEEKKTEQERKAREEFEEGKENATSVYELLQKLSKPNQINLYYSGGIQLLTAMIKQNTEQALFRINNGFSIINSNNIVKRCISGENNTFFDEELCLSVLGLWYAVCKKNEENQQLLIQSENGSKYLIDPLTSSMPEIQKECLSLLCLYSQTEYGRTLLLKNLDLPNSLEKLTGLLNQLDMFGVNVLEIIANFTSAKRFKVAIRPYFKRVILHPFLNLLKNVPTRNLHLLPQAVSLLGSMAEDSSVCKEMSDCKELWNVCLFIMEEYKTKSSEYTDVLLALLGLMVNISFEQSSVIEETAADITDKCLVLLCSADGSIITRSAGLLSHILPQSTDAVNIAVNGGIVKILLKMLKVGGQKTLRYALKALATCAKNSQRAQEQVVQLDKKFKIFLKLLDLEDEMIVSLAALCLGHCVEIPGAATSLLSSDIVKVLLKHAGGDSKKTAVQQNAAIALGKLCTSEPRHRIQLRKLNGLEILNSCMKHII
ncbi:tetratricopeptide repeat protein 12 isoform X2 [Erpetoichthys calabaricus]|uniref:tetratricopeptide repeat protein 12 isoform X2 n=1 Tax=Erpetoichthys calabaricus TaxID=27687 RepID=UPI002234BE56|nr:tetratricopeptide repeat protein 12 isoform X2 [Erpetoichthys calabaricus]